ncbi:MAG: hypothetical protein D6736_19940 [Nitrospinota bacterium]|nr:MAG: hypothetical protein D6736_19940 [Nitrospinota bacterium]
MNWEKVKFGLFSALGGAILLAIVGFSWGGWVTSGTAQEAAEEMAAEAVAARLASICVAQFAQDVEKDQKFKELQAKTSWQRKDYVVEQGWATMVGEEKPDSQVAIECANRILQASR